MEIFTIKIETPFGKQHIINALLAVAENIKAGIVKEGTEGKSSGPSGNFKYKWDR